MNPSLMARISLVGVVILATACASGPAATPQRNSAVITDDELLEVPELNCYQAVQRLRPAWLRTRGRSSLSGQQGIRLYVDGGTRGFVSEMSSIRSSAVERMQYLSGTQATARFGIDHGDGAILLTLRKG